MTLIEQWRKLAYGEGIDKNQSDAFWAEYFEVERKIYEQLLKDPKKEVKGTVKSLAKKFKQEVLTMVGFLDGIDDSLIQKNPLETMDEDTEVSLAFEPERLYKNMVKAKADWLYELSQWESIFDEETRARFYKEEKASGTIRKDKKIGRNDPCPCKSGRKYKQCCGRNT